MRGADQLPGAALADVVMIDQHDPKWSLAIPAIVNQIPLSRHYLEHKVHPFEPSPESLMVIESVVDLLEIARGDLLLVDRKQATLGIDGVYLLNLPGFTLRGVFNRPQVISRLSNRAPPAVRARLRPMAIHAKRLWLHIRSTGASCSETGGELPQR
jgi:hypothetical protein